jgi:hypothetical protein
MARPHIEPFVETNVAWKKMTLPGFGKGMRYKMLSLDTDTGACSMKVMLEPGYRQPPGMSYSEMEMFVLSGSVTVGDQVHGPGYYFFVPAAPGASSRCCTSTPDRGAELPVLHDARFKQDNISYHDSAEESYHIWGTSWMMQFGELPTGGYFWRPPYINHGSFRCKYGTIAFGRTDSILFNYFHFNPWTNPDENRMNQLAPLPCAGAGRSPRAQASNSASGTVPRFGIRVWKQRAGANPARAISPGKSRARNAA